ncbi:MAG: glutamate racemase [Proteobacteria bacterium]|nr:glutamate racemase [Pseudomonadota bacterium]
MNHKAIGVFDSGVGGLTVLDAIRQVLPNEDYIFLGDTARVPYGNRTRQTIIRYATSCVHQLVARDVKAIVIACNTASAYALDALTQMLDIPVFGVIEPAAQKAVQLSHNRCVGIIGTRATIHSQAYVNAIQSINNDVKVYGMPCPLFVPIVEEGWANSDVARLVVSRYLADLLKDVEQNGDQMDTLILGCTHYPILKTIIAKELAEMGKSVELCDCAQATAASLAKDLQEHHLLSDAKSTGNADYLVTDDPAQFSMIGKSFMKVPPENVEHIDIV